MSNIMSSRVESAFVTYMEKAADSSLDFEKSTKNWIETEEQLNAHIREAIKVYFNETSDEDVKAVSHQG